MSDETAQVIRDLDEFGELDDGPDPDSQDDHYLTENELLALLAEDNNTNSRIQAPPAVVNPNSMVNMFTDIATALRHAVDFYITSPLRNQLETLDPHAKNTEAVLLQMRAATEQLHAWENFVRVITKSYRQERDSIRRETSSKEAKIRLGRYPVHGYDDLYDGYMRLKSVWMDPVVAFVCDMLRLGKSRDEIISKICVDDALCFQWGLVYGMLLLAATVR
ncbi:hypothetical protein HK405_006387, partial [Cladochytrium tenue]